MFNIIMILLIIAGIAFAVQRYIKGLDTIPEYEEDDETNETETGLDYLINETAKAFARELRRNMNDDNLTRDQLKRKSRRRAALREAMAEAGYGSESAKRVVKNNIKELLLDDKYGIDEKSIEEIIPFSKTGKLKSIEKFEILLFLYNQVYGTAGFAKMMNEYELSRPVKEVDGTVRYVVTKEILNYVYQDVMAGNSQLGKIHLEFNDKIEILAQRIYEKYIGLGPVDMLYYSTIDEIDAGTSGIPFGSFAVRTKQKNLPYSYESIWVMYHGENIHMECLSFETQAELERVCDNIYKFDPPFVLSREQGRVVSTMIDGSRIVVTRPPFAESFAFFLRKFDSTPSLRPDELVHGDNAVIPILLSKWFIKGQRNIAITGEQGCGKTTFLKSIIRFIENMNLRIQELQFEMNLRYTYPQKNIMTFQETAAIDAQEGLNLQKKTNGAVNIIGEVADAKAASYLIQTSMVASLFALFTHHAKTTQDLVEAISNNLLELGLYKDKKDAVAMVVKVLRLDIHWTKGKGIRYMERITEVVPITESSYPTEKMEAVSLASKKEDIDKMTALDTMEYFRRVTDPKQYIVKDIVRWERDEKGNGKFVFFMPSDGLLKDIKDHLSIEEEKEFLFDLNMMQRLSDGDDAKEVREWEKACMQF